MRNLASFLSALLLASVGTQAQPSPAPESGDAPCENPPSASVEPDRSHEDADGFSPLFNGADFSGWWLNCRTEYSAGDTVHGPIFRVDRERSALYTSQRGAFTGGMLMTRAKFSDYELVFDYWPDWGNDAGVVHRVETSGRGYNMTLSYLAGGSLGGVWGELGFTSRDFRPFAFTSSESTLAIPGNGNGESSNWTRITQKLKAAGDSSIPCPEDGCTQTDWRRLWDFDGWNQIRIRISGALDTGSRFQARSWFRKPGATDWVPLSADTTLLQKIPPGYIGLIVHGGGEYSGSRGTWYRNIRWRPWPPVVPDRNIRDGKARATQRPAVRWDKAHQGLHIVFPDADIKRNLRILTLDGKLLAEMRDVGGEAFLSTAGWKRSVYLLRMDGEELRGWASLILP